MNRRTAAAAAAAALVLAAPAAAHGPTATQAGYVSNVNAVLPNVLGLSANVVGGDVWLRLSNYSGKEIVILGYQGEPYLRFGHDEVFQNTRAPTTYVNRFRGLHARVPATASATAPPAWEKVADGALVRVARPPHLLGARGAAARREGEPRSDPAHLRVARPGPGRRRALRDHRHPRLPARARRAGPGQRLARGPPLGGRAVLVALVSEGCG